VHVNVVRISQVRDYKMPSHMIGAAPERKEDRALLTGRGRFIDDIHRPGMLYMGVVRSPHAHARVKSIKGALDLPEVAHPIPPYKAKRKFRAYEQPVLATQVVRYVGEAVAVVVAEDARSLAGALEAVEVEYEPLPAVSTTEAALRTGAPRVHAEWPDNVAYVGKATIGDVDAAIGKADLVVKEALHHPRLSAMPIETRGALAYLDEAGALVVLSTTQHPYHLREAIADVLRLVEEEIRVMTPDVGGSFGAKGQVHSEDIAVAALALKLRRPVKWIESRNEHFIATCHDREQSHEVRAGFAKDGTIAGIEDRFAADFGAYPVQEDGVTINTINHLCGPYRVAALRSVCTNVVTHKMFSAAYRAAGRPEAVFVMERMLDIAARKLGIDPAEIRRRNLIPVSAQPYKPGLIYKDGVPVSYDPGDFPASFDKLLTLFGYAEARATQKRQGTKRTGIGLACYMQGTAVARAAREVRAKAIKVASALLEAAEQDIRISEGRAHVVGVPAHGVTLSALAREAIRSKVLMPDPGLNACVYFNPETVTWAFGANAATVEVDIETCEIRLLKFAAVHDCGRPINPVVVDGQLHGGLVQGIGAALMEEIVYDEAGQIQGASFMDYALPKADDLPPILTAQLAYPSVINELGIKGVGESGCIAPGAAIANAVEDAVADLGVVIRELPITPARLFRLLHPTV
jgi:carbon-monoxide dehydrogenase large subunit